MASDESKVDTLPPAAQPEPSYHSSKSTTGSNGNVTVKRGPSPTFRDPYPEPGPTAVDTVTDAPVQSSQDRPKKRVRLVGPIDEPENPFTQQSQHSQRSQQSQPRASNNSLASSQTAETSETTSTVPSNLSRTAWTFRRQPPSSRDVQETIESYGEPSVVYQEPFYSNRVDVPPRAKMFGGRMFSIKGSAVADLQEFDSSVPFMGKRWLKTKTSQNGSARYGWEYGLPPPSFDQVVDWCTKQDDEAREQGETSSSATTLLYMLVLT
jgi:DNA polymerase zeta